MTLRDFLKNLPSSNVSDVLDKEILIGLRKDDFLNAPFAIGKFSAISFSMTEETITLIGDVKKERKNG